MAGQRDYRAEPLSGGCQCGAIRYRITAEPVKPHICHCRMCQKASGSAFMAFAETELGASFVWTRGSPAWFRSSEAVERGFCSACGTSLHFRYVGSTRLDVSLASLDEPEAIMPAREFGGESRLKWLDRLGHLPISTTEGSTPAEALRTYASRQHPDHD
jgi:hypothetical protein